MQYAFCKVSLAPIRAEKTDRSEMVSQLLFGEIIEIKFQEDAWCSVQTLDDNYIGFVEKKLIHNLTEKEVRRWIQNRELLEDLIFSINSSNGIINIVKGSYISSEANFNIGDLKYESITDLKESFPSIETFAKSYLNAPYLWGGKSPFGIDCSGFTQVVYRNFGINLPRDAYQQAELGVDVEFDDVQANDLAFFSNKDGRIVHVGIILEDKNIIHSSGNVKIDSFTKDGIFNNELNSLTHQLFCIKRI